MGRIGGTCERIVLMRENRGQVACYYAQPAPQPAARSLYMSIILNTIVPVFGIIGLGYVLARRRELHLPTLADLAMLITSPALIFSVLVETDMEMSRWAVMVGGTGWIAAGTAVLAWAYVRRDVAGRRGMVLPAVFWNSGNMALPCAQLAFGPDGLEAAIMVFIAMATLQSTIGIWIAKGDGGLAEMFRMPLMHACVAGLVVNVAQIPVPQMILTPVTMVGDMAIPLMLLNLGVQLRTLHVTDVRHSLVGVAIRMGGGFVFGLLFVFLFHIGGVNRNVLLLDAIMPPAVINIVMAQRYDAHPALVASTIVLGTLLSMLAIPVLLLFLT